MKIIQLLIVLVYALNISACSKDDAVVFVMEVSFEELFVQACETNLDCVSVAETYVTTCFDKSLALSTIKAESAKEKSLTNYKQIRLIKNCLHQRSGTEHWKYIDMVKFFNRMRKEAR